MRCRYQSANLPSAHVGNHDHRQLRVYLSFLYYIILALSIPITFTRKKILRKKILRKKNGISSTGSLVSGDSMCADWCLNSILWVCRKLSSNML